MRVGVMCKNWEEFVMIHATVFCTFWIEYLEYLNRIFRKAIKEAITKI